jgi:glycosyltransferase involved in cell wall biosynthesis
MVGLGKLTQKKCLILHFNSKELSSSQSEYRWRHFKSIYSYFESKVFLKTNRIFLTDKVGLQGYKTKYRNLAQRFSYISQWVDNDLFRPNDDAAKIQSRLRWSKELPGLSPEPFWLIWVGRLESTKNPLLALEAITKLPKKINFKLIMIGAGSLDKEVQAAANGMSDKVVLVPNLPRKKLADLMACADLYLLTSCFETGPISLLEALACGVPAVATRVGLVDRIWKKDRPGEIISADAAPEQYAAAIKNVLLAQDNHFTAQLCRSSVEPFFRDNVLNSFYCEHEKLASKNGQP